MTVPELRAPVTNWSVLALRGDIDLASAPMVRAQIGQLTSRPPAFVVLDVTGLEFIDSTGLGVFVGALRRVRDHDGDLRIAGAKPSIERVFAVTGLDRVFRLFPSVDEALEAPVEHSMT
jgi:anti-sigma B factor antagonist